MPTATPTPEPTVPTVTTVTVPTVPTVAEAPPAAQVGEPRQGRRSRGGTFGSRPPIRHPPRSSRPRSSLRAASSPLDDDVEDDIALADDRTGAACSRLLSDRSAVQQAEGAVVASQTALDAAEERERTDRAVRRRLGPERPAAGRDRAEPARDRGQRPPPGHRGAAGPGRGRPRRGHRHRPARRRRDGDHRTRGGHGHGHQRRRRRGRLPALGRHRPGPRRYRAAARHVRWHRDGVPAAPRPARARS